MAAFKTASVLLASVWFLVSCAADEQNYSQVNCNCKVLPVGDNLASEFELKASEKGVRIIYLNLKIGNDSYNPLELQDEILPDRWVWARSNREPMLSLPYDYDILSLGLLNYQVRSMTVPLKDEPSGCLAQLNSTCQNMAVGRALLDNVTLDISGELSTKSGVVCVVMIEDTHIKYHCCSANGPALYCNLPVEGSNWFDAFQIILGYILTTIMLLYWPALLLMLPDCIFKLQEERKKEDCPEESASAPNHTRNGYEEIQNVEDGELPMPEIPVDDASPVTCSTLLLENVKRLPDIGPSFNVKLTVLLICVCPFVYYVYLGLFLTLKQKFIHECFTKSVDASDVGFSFQMYIDSWKQITISSVLAFTCFVLALCLRPEDLFLQKEEGMESCFQCSLLSNIMSITPLITENSTDSMPNISDKIRQHLKLSQKVVYFSMSRFLKLYYSGLKLLTINFKRRSRSRITRALFILLHLISILSMLFFSLVLGAICFLLVFILILVLAFLSPSVTCFFFLLFKSYQKLKVRFSSRPLRCFFCFIIVIYLFTLALATFLMLSIICYFIFGLLGLTIMGVVVNVEIVTPYVTAFLIVTTNIYFCYINLQSRYKEVKGFISKYWQQKLQIKKDDTIPVKLFWFVCDRAFPVKTEICLMFRNMFVILTFLYLAISSIIFFGNTYDISTLVSTIAVFITGTIPSLFFKGLTRGNNFTGWGKIKLEREIKTAVEEYPRQSGRNLKRRRRVTR